MAAISICRNESGNAGRDGPGQKLYRRDQKDGHLRARGERDLRGELDLPAGGNDNGPAVLGGVADDGNDNGGDEELGEAHLVREGLDRPDEGLGDERRHDRGCAEDDQ